MWRLKCSVKLYQSIWFKIIIVLWLKYWACDLQITSFIPLCVQLFFIGSCVNFMKKKLKIFYFQIILSIFVAIKKNPDFIDKSRLFTLPTSYQRNFTLYWGEAYQIIECLFYSYINYYYIYIKFIISFAFTWNKVVCNIFFIISGFMRIFLKQEVRIKW